jgi:hypothetical protein
MKSKPICEKLDIKEGYKIKLINEPDNYAAMLSAYGNNFSIEKKLSAPVDLIHLFTKSQKELSVEFPVLKNFIKESGSFWVSWPNKSAKVISDLNGDVVKKIGIKNGLAVSKICMLDEDWVALKFIFKGGSE